MRILTIACLFAATVYASHAEEPNLSIEKTLKKIAILFRHGDRSLHDIGGSGGSAQLTINGERRMYFLGKFIRKRYKNFLTDDTSEIKARSIALNRCINSLEVVLAALYPARDEKTQIVPGLTWQPIPIAMEPLEEDPILFTESFCPKADQSFKSLKTLPEVKQINEENKDFFKMVSEKSGRVIRDYTSASHFQDDLLVYKVENMTLPNGEWLTDEIYDKLTNFTDLLYTFRSMDPVLQRLRGGPFIEEVINVLAKNESEIIYTGAQDDEDQSSHKLYIYAAKRYTISLVLSALGAFNNKSALAGASVFFELHEWNDQQYIRVLHLVESETEEVFPLTVRGCPSVNCPWDTFVSSADQSIPKDLKAECSLSSSAERPLFPQVLPVFFGLLFLLVNPRKSMS